MGKWDGIIVIVDVIESGEQHHIQSQGDMNIINSMVTITNIFNKILIRGAKTWWAINWECINNSWVWM